MILGADVLGRSVLGQLSAGSTIFLPVTAASFAVTPSTVKFAVFEPVTQATYTVSGVVSSVEIFAPVASRSYAVTASNVAFALFEPVSPASYSLAAPVIGEKTFVPVTSAPFAVQTFAVPFRTSIAVVPAAYVVTGYPVTTAEWEPVATASFAITANDVPLIRTGFDYEVQQGGIGHLLYEMEQAKRLNAITRTIPPPVDRRTAPTFRPVARPPVAPIAPAVDMAAIQKQRMDEAAAKAKAAKNRRDEEAILLLAS